MSYDNNGELYHNICNDSTLIEIISDGCAGRFHPAGGMTDRAR